MKKIAFLSLVLSALFVKTASAKLSAVSAEHRGMTLPEARANTYAKVISKNKPTSAAMAAPTSAAKLPPTKEERARQDRIDTYTKAISELTHKQ